MRKFAFGFAAALALALTVLFQPASQATAAGAATLTLSDSTPTRTESWGTVVHHDSIAVKTGTVVTIELAGQVLPGHEWQVTWAEVKCTSGVEVRTDGGGLLSCDGKALTADGRGLEFTMAQPVLSPSGKSFEVLLPTPNASVTIRVDYAYFPPMKPGQQSNSAIKVFEANVVVQP